MTTPTLNRLSPTEHAAVRILRALELNGPANWRTVRDCYVGTTHRAAVPNAMRALLAGGHIVARVVPDRKYHSVLFERGTGLPAWLDRDLYDAARATPLAGIRRRDLAPTKTTRSRRCAS